METTNVTHNDHTDIVWPCEPAPADVLSIRTVVRDGWYNMPTDLVRWKNYYWLSYRRSTGHGAVWGNSSVVVLRSNDLRRWYEAKVFDPPGGVVDGQGIAAGHYCDASHRLYIFCPVQMPGEASIYVWWTEDGVHWSDPEVVQMGHIHPYTWRVRHHDGRFYSAICYLEHPEGPFDLIVSDDAIHWTKHAQIADTHPKHFTEESDLHWRPNGQLWCIVRSHGSALMYWSKPPYTKWEDGVDLGVRCDAPATCASEDRVYLAGRVAAEGNPHGTTGIYQLVRGDAELIVSMPAGGDSSYPGLISPEPGRLVMSYYSDVAYWSGLVKPRHFDAYGRKKTECDIYVAEIQIATTS